MSEELRGLPQMILLVTNKYIVQRCLYQQVLHLQSLNV